jgi:hypothetical protein
MTYYHPMTDVYHPMTDVRTGGRVMSRRLRCEATSQRTARQLPERPPHPAPDATPSEFAEAIGDLRKWAGLTLQGLKSLDMVFLESSSSFLYATGNPFLTLPEPPQAPSHYQCPVANGWAPSPNGRNICVETNQKHVAMLTIPRRAAPETGTI